MWEMSRRYHACQEHFFQDIGLCSSPHVYQFGFYYQIDNVPFYISADENSLSSRVGRHRKWLRANQYVVTIWMT